MDTALTFEVAVRMLAPHGQRRDNVGREREVALIRIIQESLTNIARHAEAKRVTLDCEQSDHQVVWTIRDDGEGFDVDQALLANTLGLVGMRERAAVWGGTVTFSSTEHCGSRQWS